MNAVLRLGLLAIPTFLAVSCTSVPITGRTQLNFIPDSTLMSMSEGQYEEVKAKTPISTDAKGTAQIQRVGQRLSQAVEAYLRDHGQAAQADSFAWEYTLFQSDQVNAWAMPGGKIAFYSAILPVCRDDTGVAVVMSHEIAHVVARHGAERMTQGLMTQMGGVALAVALNDKPSETQALWLAAYGAGATVGVILPYSRIQEYEADRLGITFMAMAGYDPREAVDFWIRMQDLPGKGGKPPEFLSTHPSDANRIQKIKEALPEAMRYYQQGE